MPLLLGDITLVGQGAATGLAEYKLSLKGPMRGNLFFL